MTRTTKTTKRNTRSIETPSIVLKTIHDDIMRDNANATLTTKKMRATLRVHPTMRDIHVRNSSWIFTTSQYDDVRALFDAKYRAKIERASKRNTSTRKRATSKNDAPTNDASNDANAQNDA